MRSYGRHKAYRQNKKKKKPFSLKVTARVKQSVSMENYLNEKNDRKQTKKKQKNKDR